MTNTPCNRAIPGFNSSIGQARAELILGRASYQSLSRSEEACSSWLGPGHGFFKSGLSQVEDRFQDKHGWPISTHMHIMTLNIITTQTNQKTT